jgi:hypothetical protein
VHVLPRRIALIALAVVGAVVALPVVVFALYSGSFLDLPTGPRASDERVVEARAAGAARLTGLADDLLATVPGGQAPLSRATDEECFRGRHNVNVDEPYDLRCTAGEFVTLAPAAQAGWAEDVAALHAAVVAAGWVGRERSLLDLVDERAAGHDVDGLAAAVYDNPDGDELSVVFVVRPPAGTPPPSPSTSGYSSTGRDVAHLVPPDGYATVLRFATTTFEE